MFCQAAAIIAKTLSILRALRAMRRSGGIGGMRWSEEKLDRLSGSQDPLFLFLPPQ